MVVVINRLKGINYSEEEIRSMDNETLCSELNSNPVLLTRYFQYRVENFFKEFVLNGQLGKITHYAIRVEFHARGSHHVHCLLWAEDAPKLTDST